MELESRSSSDMNKHGGLHSKNIANMHGVNLYKTTPYGQLTLEECEDLFRQRIEALSIMEKADLSELQIPVITSQLRDIKSYVYKTNCIVLRSTDTNQKRLDHFSHMLVRMYCVYQPNLWDWFRATEKKLFCYRLRDQASSLSGAQLEAILRSFEFNFERVTGAELNELHRENLIGWNRNNTDREIPDIFKVKFTDALKFIARRSISLNAGYAFLTRYEIITVVCDVFEKHLEHELQYARQHLNVDLYQTQQLLDSLSIVYLDFQDRVAEEKKLKSRSRGDESQNPFRINVADIPQLMKKHYPPCMRYLQEVLMQDHHLKHQARLYYGAFLRSGGVDMESAIEFWRKEFTKKIPREKFDQNYKYNIRHLYGMEGHKKALSCFSCEKIVKDNAPGPTEKHGCPFKHFDDTHLKSMLIKHELKEVDIESIFMHRNDKDYTLACSHYFKSTRGVLPSEPIKTPIHFYYESMRHEHRPPPTEENEVGEKDEVQDTEMVEDDAVKPVQPVKELTGGDDFDDEMNDY